MKGWIWTLGVMFLFGSIAQAQKPLNKKDQKKKAEFEAMIAAEEKYEELMTAADLSFKEKEYVKARMTYEEAIQYNAEKKQWLVSKVNDLDILMARNIARKVDSIFVLPKVDEVALESDLKTESNLEERSSPTPLTLPEKPVEKIEEEPPAIIEESPKEEPVPDPIEELVEIAEDIPANKPKERAVVKPKVEKKEPIEKVKVKDDFADLPQGMSEAEFDYPDHHVWRIVVKDGIDTIVYKRVKHRWGGDFCFKDDVSISQRIWNEEVEAYREKYPSK